MAKKRAQLDGKKFTLGDIDTTLWQVEEHLANGEYTDAKRLVTNARNRLDIIRGVAPKGRGKRLSEEEVFVQSVFMPTIEKELGKKFPERKLQKYGGEVWSYGKVNAIAVIAGKARRGKSPACTVSFVLRLNGKSSKTQTDYAAAKVWFEKVAKTGWGEFKVNRRGELTHKQAKLLNVTADEVLLVASDFCKVIKDLEAAV
jgi:hypothetical protein